MANARDINLDIVGHDKTGRAARSAAANLDRVRRQTDEVRKATEKMSAATQAVGRRLGNAVGAVAKFAGAIAAIGANVPMFISAVAALGKFGGGVVSAASALAVFGAVAYTAFSAIQEASAKTSDLRDKIKLLGEQREVAKAAGDMEAYESITKAQNKAIYELQARYNLLPPPIRESVRQLDALKGAWSKFVEQNQPRTLGIFASSFRTLAKLIPQLQPLFDAGARAVERFVRWLERKVDDGSIRNLIRYLAENAGPAFDSFNRGIEKTIELVQRATTWWRTNQDAITAAKTALAGIAIAVGIATGGWLLVLGGAVALIVTYWDQLKAALQRVREWFVNLYNTSPAVQDAVARIKDGVQRFRDGVIGFLQNAAPGFRDFMSKIGPLIQAAMPYLGRIAQSMGAIAQTWLPILGKLVSEFLSFVGGVVGGITTALNKFRAFSSGVREKLLEAAEFVSSGVQKIRNKFNELKDKTVSVLAKFPDVTAPIRSLKDKLATLVDKIINVRVNFPDISGAVAGIRNKLSFLPGFSAGGALQTRALAPTFATAGFAAAGPVGGAVTVRTGPTTVDARVFLDGRELSAVARSVVHDEQSRAAFRARYGRRA